MRTPHSPLGQWVWLSRVPDCGVKEGRWAFSGGTGPLELGGRPLPCGVCVLPFIPAVHRDWGPD